MHVHNHFRHFALQPKTSVQTRETRKKAAGLENTERVESRFAEDDEEDAGQGGGQQRRPFHTEETTGTSSGHIASAPIISPAGPRVAISANGAPRASGSEIERKGAVAESSLESLLALTRAAARES